ncbi:MAG: M20/M25/M40 family metallo-hydrolase [Deltaproteobacteria bacterium]|nr:M20/M25/M40 family metallo-hydrolase [Deltaproteobacteria bacterium]
MSNRLDELQYLDEKYLIDTLSRLLKIPTHVPLGPNTLMEADDPVLVHYVHEVIRPELMRIGAYEVIEAPLNQLIVRMGRGETDQKLLVMVYTPTQHANLMDDPFSGKIAIPQGTRYNEPCIFGQGASQNKAHMAAMLTVLKLMVDRKIDLSGTLFFAVNNEGRSSHHCTDAILSALDTNPKAAVLAIGTDMKISLGNRGRVDVYIHVKGKPTHSSDPDSGLSAIDGAFRVMKRLEKLDPKEEHPLLGRQRLLVYQIVYEPIAPHTLPGKAKLTLDRRLLPGDDPDRIVTDIREVIGDLSPYKIEVEKGVTMLPALVDENEAIVQVLKEASRQIRGKPCATEYARGTFDAGGLTSKKIPAVMFGASGGRGGILGEDFVCLREVIEEARMLGFAIMNMLG